MPQPLPRAFRQLQAEDETKVDQIVREAGVEAPASVAGAASPRRPAPRDTCGWARVPWRDPRHEPRRRADAPQVLAAIGTQFGTRLA